MARGDGVVVRAAGAVPWRTGPGEPEVALVHRDRYDDWTFPKGKQEPGEHLLLTAVREVEEESGLRVVLGRPLPAQEYQAGGAVKRVSYWAGHCTAAAPFVPNHEVDQVCWHPASEAAKVLSYPRDGAVLAGFLAGRADTVPVILLRHAEAGRKEHQDPAGRRAAAAGTDLVRPLAATGIAQARALAGMLACYGPARVVSSPAERCLATVRPYAAAAGVPVHAEDALLVEAGAGHEVAGARAARATRLVARMALSGEPGIICAHRENMPALISAVFAAVGTEPPAEPLGKAEFVVAHLAGHELAAAERHRPGS
ncbi:MAG TPA: NUDIX hydrolase [Streptosporangiaceae bacterium]